MIWLHGQRNNTLITYESCEVGLCVTVTWASVTCHVTRDSWVTGNTVTSALTIPLALHWHCTGPMVWIYWCCLLSVCHESQWSQWSQCWYLTLLTLPRSRSWSKVTLASQTWSWSSLMCVCPYLYGNLKIWLVCAYAQWGYSQTDIIIMSIQQLTIRGALDSVTRRIFPALM